MKISSTTLTGRATIVNDSNSSAFPLGRLAASSLRCTTLLTRQPPRLDIAATEMEIWEWDFPWTRSSENQRLARIICVKKNHEKTKTPYKTSTPNKFLKHCKQTRRQTAGQKCWTVGQISDLRSYSRRFWMTLLQSRTYSLIQEWMSLPTSETVKKIKQRPC